MRTALVVVLLLAAAGPAQADIFAFKDLDGYEACLRTDHVVERIDTPKGAQTRLLTETEIQARCVDAAVKLVAGLPRAERVFEYVKATKRLSSPVNAIELVGVVADKWLPACNELEGYEVVTAALSRPRGDDYVKKARVVAKKCLKDRAFVKDFVEEADSSDPYLSANACAILREEKLVKVCKEAK